MNVTYRDYRAADAEAVKTILDEAFAIVATVGAAHLREPAREVYLRDRLATSTWAQVAEADGNVVGIICGRIPGQSSLPGHWGHRLATVASVARAVITGIAQYKSLAKYPRLAASCVELRKRTAAPTTDELTLFAVAADTRGLGVGRGLYERFCDYLRDHGRTDYFLYTDDKSSYGFYESRGMTRAATKDIRYRYNGKPSVLKTMLYTGSL
ncbi:GNAT family N-acetyltransferase [Isoptericola sp. NPDC019482]|uniref:GNAT family N-acetyltransferase n=1 Tax=Isoptericola sp. NPDC019482 TaxID=3154688 RepID=UPI00348F7EDF